MRQRVAIARTLAFEPTILLMDEPFASLDEQTRLLLGEKVLQIQEQLRQTTLLITHNITEAVQLADRILVMTYRPGRVKRVVDIKLPRPRTSDVVTSEARPLCRRDLERPARGGHTRHAGGRGARGADRTHDLPGTYAAIGFVVLVSIVFFDVTERIERWLRPGS
jgi:NitT/TauT family transport system ATP-binding protein